MATKYNPRILAVAASMPHVEGYFNSHAPAFVNRNPGNITRWPGVTTAGRFCVFPSRSAGFDALYRDVEANRYSTLRAFITKYAPPNENNTSKYLEAVVEFSGILPDEVIAPESQYS